MAGELANLYEQGSLKDKWVQKEEKKKKSENSEQQIPVSGSE